MAKCIVSIDLQCYLNFYESSTEKKYGGLTKYHKNYQTPNRELLMLSFSASERAFTT